MEDEGLLTLDGDAVEDGVAIFPRARKVGIFSSADVSSVNFTFTGTDINGAVLTETIAGPNGDPETAFTQNYFLTVSEIYADATTGVNEISGAVSEELAVTVFSGASRIKGVYFVSGTTDKLLEFRKGSSTGPSAMSLYTMSDNASQDIMVPEMGIRYETGCVLTYNGESAFKGLTVFHA
jgi:hypothetical protein